jgi:hypothetical protein
MKLDGQRGNSAILLLYFSLSILLLSVFSLDLFSLLYAKRAAQTAADAAATGILRAVSETIGPKLYEIADGRVKGWWKEAKTSFDQESAAWTASNEAAITECKGASDCILQWLSAHPSPNLRDVEKKVARQYISGNVGNTKSTTYVDQIVNALVGEGEASLPEEVDAVLDDQTKVCTLLSAKDEYLYDWEDQARLYAELNGAKRNLTEVQVPFRNRAEVYAKVKWSVPTLFLHRLIGKNLYATGEAAASVFSLEENPVKVTKCYVGTQTEARR